MSGLAGEPQADADAEGSAQPGASSAVQSARDPSHVLSPKPYPNLPSDFGRRYVGRRRHDLAASMRAIKRRAARRVAHPADYAVVLQLGDRLASV